MKSVLAGLGALFLIVSSASPSRHGFIPNRFSKPKPAKKSACGVERWAEKIMTDTGSLGIDLSSDPILTTVSDIREMAVPSYDDKRPRVGNETKIYEVMADIIGYKKEADRDFHVVIASTDDHSETMVVEFVDPACAFGSKAIDRFSSARKKFLDLVPTPPTKRFTTLDEPITVSIIGPVFFDRVHGQTGVAPNGQEIHPVLSISDQRDALLEPARNNKKQLSLRERTIEWLMALLHSRRSPSSLIEASQP